MNKKRYTQKELNYVREVAVKMLEVKDKEIKAFKKDNYGLNCTISDLESKNHRLEIDLKHQIKMNDIKSEFTKDITKIYDDAFTKNLKQLEIKNNIIATLVFTNVILFGLVIKGLL